MPSMEGRIEGSNRRMMDLVDACRVSSPDFPQIPTYVKRNEANPSPTLLLPTEVSNIRDGVTSRRDASVDSAGKRNEEDEEMKRRETSPIQFVSLTIGPCLR